MNYVAPRFTNKDELIKFVYNKLLDQGGPSLYQDKACAYRGENNRRCAAGWCIDDMDILPRPSEDDELSINKIYEGQTLEYINITYLNEFLRTIQKLQGIHDLAYLSTTEGVPWDKALEIEMEAHFNFIPPREEEPNQNPS